jgi:uncharacterized membrane protein
MSHPRSKGPRVYRPFCLVPMTLMASIFIFGPGSLPAQEQAPPSTYIPFNVPGAGTGKNQGTMPVAIARGWIAGNVVGPHNFLQGFRRAPNGSYKLVDVPGSHYTVVMGVNLRGQVVGYFFEKLLRGFLRDTDGTYIEVTPPDAEDTIVRCINGDGQVGGDAVSATEAYGFVWDRTTGFTKFGVSSDPEPGVFAINGSGVVTGSYYDANDNAHGYVRFPSGKIETFDASADAVTTWPTAINASGQVTGYVDTRTSSRGFVRDPDGTITLFLSGTQGHAYPKGINNSGYIVGFIQQPTGPSIPFERDPSGNVTFLQLPHPLLFNEPQGIDGDGTIVGWYTDGNIAKHGWRLIP